MHVDEKTVRRIAHLARIKITDDEAAGLESELSAILDWVEQLSEVDTESVEPTTHPLRFSNVFRTDQVKQSLSSQEALDNAPQKHGEFFAVPKVLE